jgi:hypothetical protein
MPAITVPKLEACWNSWPAVAALEPFVSQGGFGAWWDEQSTSRETLSAALTASARGALRKLVATTRTIHCGTVEVVAAAEQLIGLGPGGTPSGDDALIGFLGAWLRLGSSPAAASNVAAVVAPRAHARTTRLAAEFYYHLAYGRLSYPLDQLLRAVALRDDRLVAQSADRLARYGATSGRDTITGVHAYLLTRLAANGNAR